MADSKTQWKKNKVHKDITLPSGTKVDIQLPDLAALLKGGQIPNSLIEVATKIGTGQLRANSDEVTKPEVLAEIAAFHAYLVSKTVVDPALTQEEVESEDFPSEDKSVLVQFALRERDTDVVGHHLAGLEKLDSFREFRGLDAGIPGLLGS